MEIHASGEDYLEAILVLHKKMGTVRSVDVARHMEVSKPRDSPDNPQERECSGGSSDNAQFPRYSQSTGHPP